MNAVVISDWGGPEKLVLRDVPDPKPGRGEVLIRVRAFGINHAESYFRQGVWGDVARITGIECVGEVEHDPSERLKKGQTVAAIVGGLGRDRNGSYAEFVVASTTNVFVLDRGNMSWENLAAIPEVYATAWWCLIESIKLSRGGVLLVRGGTSSLGQAAINIALEMGCQVLASSRGEEGIKILKGLEVASPLRRLEASVKISERKSPRDRCSLGTGGKYYPEGLPQDGETRRACLHGRFLGRRRARRCFQPPNRSTLGSGSQFLWECLRPWHKGISS
jgi:NADPH2:quinone reductase